MTHQTVLILNQQLWWMGFSVKTGNIRFCVVFLFTWSDPLLTFVCVWARLRRGIWAWPRWRRAPGSCPGSDSGPPGTWRAASACPPRHCAPVCAPSAASGWWSSREAPRDRTRGPRARAETWRRVPGPGGILADSGWCDFPACLEWIKDLLLT